MTPIPRYQQIADDLRRRLAKGEFPVGTKLPPIAELQKRYDCENNLNMIRHAQSVLIDEGLIDPRQGQGTFVIALPPDPADQAALADAAEELKTALDTAQAALTKFLARLTRSGAATQDLLLAVPPGPAPAAALSTTPARR
jgi:DNA-binding GntR family transcriptional regulator